MAPFTSLYKVAVRSRCISQFQSNSQLSIVDDVALSTTLPRSQDNSRTEIQNIINRFLSSMEREQGVGQIQHFDNFVRPTSSPMLENHLGTTLLSNDLPMSDRSLGALSLLSIRNHNLAYSAPADEGALRSIEQIPITVSKHFRLDCSELHRND